jgi:hypothetical protein
MENKRPEVKNLKDCTINETENELSYIYIDGDDKEQQGKIDLRLKNGTLNDLARGIIFELKGEEILKKYENTESKNNITPPRPKQKATITDPPTEKKGKLSAKAKLFRGIVVTAIATALIAGSLHACSEIQKGKTNSKVTLTPTPTTAPILNDNSINQADSRFTKIDENLIIKTTENLIQELNNHGIDIETQDAVTLVAFGSMTHMQATSPDLLKEIFGKQSSEEIISRVGHVIGQIVTNEVTVKDNSIDWSMIFMDNTDKKIAEHGIDYVINEAKHITEDKELSHKQKINKIQELIRTKFIAPNYDKTIGYEFSDGTRVTLPQEDGADFITDAIITGILMGDNTLKNYINVNVKHHSNEDSTWETVTSYGPVTDDLKAISENHDNVSNITRLIEACQFDDSQKTNIKSK